MDRASSLIYPGSRTLAGWWRQLQPWQPQAFHVGYLFVHRVEVLVQVRRMLPVEGLHYLLLRAIALDAAATTRESSGVDAARLAGQLNFPPAILRQMLTQMATSELLTGAGDGPWRLTDCGRLALEGREYPAVVRERRTFPFVEWLGGSGARTAPPSFMPIAECPGTPWRVDEPFRFDLSLLRESIGQAAAWKDQQSFPRDVDAVCHDVSSSTWQQVVIDRPERVLVALISTAKPDRREWLAFAAKTDGWELFHDRPVLQVPEPVVPQWQALNAPPLDLCEQAWRAWCRQRNLPAHEAEQCKLHFESPRLFIEAPSRFVQRLRAAKSDLLKGEAWLLLDDEYVRSTALLTLR